MKQIFSFSIKFICLLIGLFLSFSVFADEWESKRERMIINDLAGRDITDSEVLNAMRQVKRHRFVPEAVSPYSYMDRPLPIGEGQTISQPYIVALMTQLLQLKPGMKVLEIGTGSGYQAAVLKAMKVKVYSIEIISALADRTQLLFETLKLDIVSKDADGYYGWKEYAPFDRIIITAAANHVPRPLIDQLKPSGKLILPLGNTRYFQTLTLITRLDDGKTDVEYFGSVRFVPMTGQMLK